MNNNPIPLEQVCEYCGDPLVEPCNTKHREWIMVLPGKIRKGDAIKWPMDGSIHQVASVERSFWESDWDGLQAEFTIHTVRKERFLISYPKLPVLVKRDVKCGWPRCELHCTRCMRIAEQSVIERDKMREEGTLPEKKRKRKIRDDPYTAERIHAVKNPARERNQAPTCKGKPRKAPTKKQIR